MKGAIEKLIQEVSFPSAGEYFSVVCVGWKDNSYKTDIFQCLASDAQRVVAKRVVGHNYSAPYIFFRPDWRFDDVSALIPVLNLPAKEIA